MSARSLGYDAERRMLEALEQMVAAANAYGITPDVCEARVEKAKADLARQDAWRRLVGLLPPLDP